MELKHQENKIEEIITAEFKFIVDPIRRRVKIVSSGRYNAIKAHEYIIKYKQVVASIDPTQYDFVIDAHRQEKCTGEVAELLKTALKMYMDTPWKSRTYVCLHEIHANAQVLCLAGDEFLNKFVIKSYIEEKQEELEITNSNMSKLEAMQIEARKILEDIKTNPSHISMYNLEEISKQLMFKQLIRDSIERIEIVIDTVLEEFEKELTNTCQCYAQCKEKETLLIRQISNKILMYDIEEVSNDKNSIYAKHLYSQAFIHGMNMQKRKQVV